MKEKAKILVLSALFIIIFEKCYKSLLQYYQMLEDCSIVRITCAEEGSSGDSSAQSA